MTSMAAEEEPGERDVLYEESSFAEYLKHAAERRAAFAALLQTLAGARLVAFYEGDRLRYVIHRTTDGSDCAWRVTTYATRHYCDEADCPHDGSVPSAWGHENYRTFAEAVERTYMGEPELRMEFRR